MVLRGRADGTLRRRCVLPMNFAAAMLIALLLDAALGWPAAIRRRIGHPGDWVTALFRGWGPVSGWAVLAAFLGIAVLTWGIGRALPSGWPGVLVMALIAWPFVAVRAAHEEATRVANALGTGDLADAKAILTGHNLDAEQVADAPSLARTALQDVADRATERGVAPLFWGALLGLPGIAVYTVIHRVARLEDVGRGLVRVEALVTLIPARMTGGLIALAATNVRRTAFRTMLRDARRSGARNEDWARAAMAGALGVRLSGGGTEEDAEIWLNPVADAPRTQDVARGLVLYQRAIAFFGLLLLFAALT